MAYIKKTYRFHGSNEMEFSYKGKYGAKGEKRQKKKKATPEQIRKQNQWNREKRMRRLMKENFRPGDLWCTLKYLRGTRKTVTEVMKDFRNFRDRLKRRYKRYGEELKFIYRMEIGARGGIHIHLLVNRIRGNPEADPNGKNSHGKPPDTALIIQEAWKPCGRIHYEPVYYEGLFQDLACYMTKQPDEAVEEQLSFLPAEDRKKLIKTDSSRNLIRPEPETKEYGHWTMRKILEEGPKSTPGFYIDPDSIVCGINPVTGMSYLQYIEYELHRQETWQQDTGFDIRGDTGKEQNGRKRRKDGMRQAVGGGRDG
ncbi:MAG: hypothetical protein IJ716_08170 [Lachnospiraceae bacterium]|nr:hypothetical protein [Lachnospiraceae bacterium]